MVQKAKELVPRTFVLDYVHRYMCKTHIQKPSYHLYLAVPMCFVLTNKSLSERVLVVRIDFFTCFHNFLAFWIVDCKTVAAFSPSVMQAKLTSLSRPIRDLSDIRQTLL